MFIVAISASLGCSASDSPRATASTDTTEPTRAPAAASAPTLWYDRVRALDLTADGQADTVRLTAEGARIDSLQVTLRIIVDGEEKHREEWGSSYELELLDSAVRRSTQADSVLRARLDSVLASVVVQSLDAPGERMDEDSALLAGMSPRPTHRVSFRYGFESMTRLAWDAPRRRFVRMWSCC